MNIIKKIQWYGFFGSIRLTLQYILTKMMFYNASIIRYPFYIRSFQKINFGGNFISGVGLRIDIFESGTLVLGRNIQVNDYVHIGVFSKIEIGDNCLIASKVFITDHNHGCYSGNLQQSNPNIDPAQRKIESNPVKIGKNVWIGENVIILPGVTIGDGCIIGASSVVAHDVPSNSLIAGCPAKVIRRYDAKSNSWIRN